MSKISLLNPKFKPAFDGLKISRDLIDKVSKALPLKEAFLFGSSVEGKNTSDSDLDILVVVPNEANLRTYFQFVNTPHFSPVAVDWIFKQESEFLKDSEIGGVSMIAKYQGKRIYPNGR